MFVLPLILLTLSTFAAIAPEVSAQGASGSASQSEAVSTPPAPHLGSNGTALPTNSTTPPPPGKAPPGFHWVTGRKDPNDPNVLFNLTGTSSTVYVDLTNVANNAINASSCSAPPCSSNNGMASFQWNVVFTLGANNYQAMQDVLEINGPNHGQCNASPLAVSPYTFSCSSLVGPGDNFEWVVDSSSGYFTDTKFILNGVTKATWTSTAIFGCSSCRSMTDVYAQATWAGPECGSGAQNLCYGNFYGGQGDMDYTGVHQFSFGPGGCCSYVTTGEYSNVEYTTPTGSGTNWDQTYNAGLFVRSQVNSGGSGSVTNPTYLAGAPDGKYTQLAAPNGGNEAWDEGSFGGSNSGTLAIYGYSYNNGGGAYYSNVTVTVSSTGTSWTKVYSAIWKPASSPSWIPIGSVTSAKYINITAFDSTAGCGNYCSYSAKIEVDSVSLFIGSYAQSLYNDGYGCYNGSCGSVSNPSNIVGLADGAYALLTAPNTGTSSYVEGNFGAEYSGQVVIDGYSYNNGGGAYYSYVQVLESSDGTTFTSVYSATWNPSTNNQGAWTVIAYVTNAQYIEVKVSYNSGYSAHVYVDAIYIA